MHVCTGKAQWFAPSNGGFKSTGQLGVWSLYVACVSFLQLLKLPPTVHRNA